MFAALFCAGVKILHKCGWDACKFYYLFVIIIALVPWYAFDYGYSETMNGYAFSFGLFVFAITVAWTRRCFIIWNNQREFDEYINQKIDELGGPSDRELIEIKGKFQYDQNSPTFNKITNDAQRSFLVSEWRKRKYNKFQFKYGFDWIAKHKQDMKDNPRDEDEDYYEEYDDDQDHEDI